MRSAHGLTGRSERSSVRGEGWHGAMRDRMQQGRSFSRGRAAVKLSLFAVALAGVLVVADRRETPELQSPEAAIEPRAPQDIAIDVTRDTSDGDSTRSISPDGTKEDVPSLPGSAGAPRGVGLPEPGAARGGGPMACFVGPSRIGPSGSDRVGQVCWSSPSWPGLCQK